MAKPIVEKIAANINDTINSVVGGDVVEGNAYNQTLKSLRPKRVDFQNAPWDDLTVLVSQMARGGGESELLRKSRVQNFLITAIVMDSITASITIDTRQNEVAADIEKALMVDPTRGGYAIDTDVGDAAPFDDAELGLTGISMEVAVSYKTLLKDPYTQG